jgi:hypothetical protein
VDTGAGGGVIAVLLVFVVVPVWLLNTPSHPVGTGDWVTTLMPLHVLGRGIWLSTDVDAEYTLHSE